MAWVTLSLMPMTTLQVALDCWARKLRPYKPRRSIEPRCFTKSPQRRMLQVGKWQHRLLKRFSAIRPASRCHSRMHFNCLKLPASKRLTACFNARSGNAPCKNLRGRTSSPRNELMYRCDAFRMKVTSQTLRICIIETDYENFPERPCCPVN